MDSIRKLMHSKAVWVLSLIAIAAVIALGVGIYNANASAGAGWGGTSGGHSVAGEVNCRRLYYDELDENGDPIQGWGEDSIDYFYNGMYYVMGDRTFGTGSSGRNGYDIYVDAARDAIYRAKSRDVANGYVDSIDEAQARVVAVAWVYTIGSDNKSYMAHTWNLSGEQSSAEQMMPPPGTNNGAQVEGVNGATQATSDWRIDEWKEPCDIPGYENKTWYDYIYETAMLDVSGEDENGNIIDGDQWLGVNLSCIVVAVSGNEIMTERCLTLEKHITGASDVNGSPEKVLYEATVGNSCYDLSGAKFQLFDSDGKTPIEARRIDSNGKSSGDKKPVIFTTKVDGSVEEAFGIKSGEYWLKEIQAPSKGYYKDGDGDGTIDELDKSRGNGKKVVVKGRNISIDGVALDPTGKLGSKDKYVFTWTDEPMKDPTAIALFKRDSLTGGLTPMPEGNASTNGAQYRFAYYKGVYNKVDQLPGYDRTTGKVDWSYSDSTALWTTRSYFDAEKNKTYTGKIDFGADAPTSGTWRYTSGDVNYCPLGTLAIVEEYPPDGYNLDPRIYLYSVTDDGTHLTANIKHTPYNSNGSDGTTDRDWNDFANDYELNGDRDDVVTPWE